MSAASIETPVYDRTARKAHQWSMVALVAAGLILQGTVGTLLLTVAAVIICLSASARMANSSSK